MMNSKDRNVLQLAYIGDAVYEIYVRKFLIDKGLVKVNDLQKSATKYVSAVAQSLFIHKLIDSNFFTESDMEVIMRARNHKTRIPKNTDIVTYKYATALEAVIGYWYLDGQNDRIDSLMSFIFKEEV